MIFSANGSSSSCQTYSLPKAEGSVHMPYSAQNPGRNRTSGNSPCAFRLASSHFASSSKYSRIVIPAQFGSQGLSIMNPTGNGSTTLPSTTSTSVDHCSFVINPAYLAHQPPARGLLSAFCTRSLGDSGSASYTFRPTIDRVGQASRVPEGACASRPPYTTHGSRIGTFISFSTSLSPTGISFLGSHLIFFPSSFIER